MIYFRYNPGGKPGMYVISSEGGRPKRLDLDDLDAFSRDGKWMYFGSNRGGERQIWKMPANGETVQMTRKGIDANSIRTGDQKRDEHLKIPDFFDVSKYPTLVFKSQKVERAEGRLRKKLR